MWYQRRVHGEWDQGKMKLNIACPETGCQKCIEIEDDRILRNFYDKRIAQEVAGDILGAEFEGYRFRISGGNDKQGFPMLQGVLTDDRVRLLLVKGSKCYRQRRTGERKRKSVRGCIVNQDLSVLNLVVVKRGAADFQASLMPTRTSASDPRGPTRSASSGAWTRMMTSARVSSAGRSPPRVARSTPRPPRSSASSPPRCSSASVTSAPSRRRLPSKRRPRPPPTSLSLPSASVRPRMLVMLCSPSVAAATLAATTKHLVRCISDVLSVMTSDIIFFPGSSK